MGRWGLEALFFLLMGSLAVYSAVGPIAKQTVVTCEFQPQAPATLRNVANPGPLQKIRVRGRLSGDGANDLYHYDGDATWLVGERPFAAPVTGSFFLAADRSIEALMLFIAHPGFENDELRVVTLNRNGILDANRSIAFLFVDPAEKLSHPARYRCQSDRNYSHIYENLRSFNWLALVGLIAVIWSVVFFARRNADKLEFGER